MASAGTIRKNRPTSIDRPRVVLYQSVAPVSPPKAEPLLLPAEVNAYAISVSPCGVPWCPDRIDVAAVWSTSEAAVKPRTTSGTAMM